jgi:hypothetical protein
MGYVAAQKTLEMQATVVLDQVALKMMPALDLRYRNVRVSIWERAIRINGISINQLGEREALRIDRVSISDIDWETVARLLQTGGLPTLPKTVRIGFDGLHLTPRMLGAQGAAAIATLGYEEISLSMSSGFLFDRANKIFGIDRMTIEGRDMGRLSYSIQLGEFPFPTDRDLVAMSRNPKSERPTPPDVSELTFVTGEIRYDDFSLLGRIDKMLTQQGKPTLAQMTKMTERLPASAGSFMGDAAKKMNKFLSQPDQSLRISARPQQPLPISSLGLEALLGPEKLAKTLDLRIEVE